jgi:hypothetical protein
MLALAVAISAISCGFRKSHLTEDFAKSYDATFAAQRVRVSKDPASAVLGLDPQEAAITWDAYRASLAPQGKEGKEEPILLIAPPSRDRMTPLRPSVPKE